MADITESNPTVFRLPRSHWHCHVSNFEWEHVHPPSLQKYYTAFLQKAIDGGAPHLLLTGGAGIGKTHLGVAAYRCMVSHVGTQLATWLNVPAFCDEVKASYKGDATSPVHEYEEARRLVVLDDLFGRDLTSHEAGQIVYRLLDTAYQNGAAVVFTMNQSVDELIARLPGHEISRVLAGATIVPMSAEKDWRLKKSDLFFEGEV